MSDQSCARPTRSSNRVCSLRALAFSPTVHKSQSYGMQVTPLVLITVYITYIGHGELNQAAGRIKALQTAITDSEQEQVALGSQLQAAGDEQARPGAFS